MSGSDSSGGISRRRFVRDAGAATVAAAGLLASSSPAYARRRRRPPTVAVFGGGIAGLTVAHELAVRGIAVELFDRSAIAGGKAHSFDVVGSGSGGRAPLPAEHGIHVYFGVYRNLGDTMRRIPYSGNAQGVHDNLIVTPQANYARKGREDLVLPIGQLDPRAYTPAQVVDTLIGLVLQTDIPPDAASAFADRMTVHMSSCAERRRGQWEKVPWDEFIRSDRIGGDYRRIVGDFSRILWGSKARQSSADFIATTFETFLLYNILGFQADGPALRALAGPAKDVLFDPWVAELRRLGVRVHQNAQLVSWATRRGRIAAGHVRTVRGHTRAVLADHYVCALPLEQARKRWGQAIRRADQQLAAMDALQCSEAPGVTLYLNARPFDTKGYVACTDSPWYLEFLEEPQFWRTEFGRTYGDGRAATLLSVNVLTNDEPGVIYGKVVRDCTPDELVHEIWEQIKQHANKPGRAPVLTDDMLIGWRLADDVKQRHGKLVCNAPVVVPIVDTARFRPSFRTRLPNLLLAGDYTDNPWGITNMEAANYSGRRAANELLARVGSHATPATLTTPYPQPEWAQLRELDRERYAAGQPNLFDTPVLSSAARQLLQRRG